MKKPIDRRFDVVVSSCRPFSQNAEYAKLQAQAIATWVPNSGNIVLVNKPEDCPGLQNTAFAPPDTDPPTIKHMIQSGMDFAVEDTTPILLINSDIFLAPGTKKILDSLADMQRERTYGVISKRYWLDLSLPMSDAFSRAETRDLGLDFFLAPKRVWAMVLKEISPHLTLGRPLWDTWLSGWMHTRLDTNYFDATNRRVVFHPDHDRSEYDRLTNFSEEQVQTVKMLSYGMPRNQI